MSESPTEGIKPVDTNAAAQKKEATKAVLFSLLPNREKRTVEAIRDHTGLTVGEVTEIISGLSSRGNIRSQDDGYVLDEETEIMASMLFTMEQDVKRRALFDKYQINPNYVAQIEQGPKFDVDHVEAEAGKFQFTREISPHEKASCFQNRVYYVWKEGPRTDEVFIILDKIPEEEVETMSPDKFLQTIIDSLQKISERHSDQDSAQLQQYILGVCYGNDSSLGWEQARLYSLNGQGSQINEIMTQMLQKGMRQYLTDLAKEKGIELPSYRLNFQERDVIPLYYDGLTQDDVRGNTWRNEDSPILLKHGTYSHILPNFVQMKGLAARDYYQSFGINKYYGGEGQGKGSYTPQDVSFWYREDGKPTISGGYGSQRAYDYPVMIGISNEKAEQLKLHLGSMDLQMEATVKNFVPAELISHIFVPSFKVTEVQQLFEQNGIVNIQVLPLRQSDN